MDDVPFFLGGPSHYEGVTPEVAEQSAMALLKAIRRLSGHGRPIIVGAVSGLFNVTFTDQYLTLASFRSVDHEWARFIKSLQLRSPYSAVPQCVEPLCHGTDDSVDPACLWAVANQSFTLGFSIAQGFDAHQIPLRACACTDGSHREEGGVCRNISLEEHADIWKTEILEFGYSESSSSTVTEGDGYHLKMFLNDHEPPHVHMYLNGDSRECVAKIRFDFVEVMEATRFPGHLRKTVISLIRERQA